MALRYVARNGRPVFRLPRGKLEPAGRCFRVTDRFETDSLEPGTYSYEIRWKNEPTADEMSAAVTLEIGSPPH